MRRTRHVVSINPRDTNPRLKGTYPYKVFEKVAGVQVVYRYATRKEADRHRNTQRTLKGGLR